MISIRVHSKKGSDTINPVKDAWLPWFGEAREARDGEIAGAQMIFRACTLVGGTYILSLILGDKRLFDSDTVQYTHKCTLET